MRTPYPDRAVFLFPRLKACAAVAFAAFFALSAPAAWSQGHHAVSGTLVDAVRGAIAPFADVGTATHAGYQQFLGCVSGPDHGAMGIHYIKGVGATLDVHTPQALIYEPKNGRLELVGAEYIVIADAWDATNPGAPPTLMGQVLNYVGSPNRYGIPAFYELHVWAAKDNPSGTFADWNPQVSCADYAP